MDLIRDERDAGFPQRPGVFVSEAGQGLPTPAPPGARAGHHSGRIMAPVMTAQDRSLIDLSGDSTVQDRSAFVSVAEAARRLGVSTATVKRRIRDGTLEAEPLSRPQGIEYRARLPRDVTVPLAAPASDVSPPLTERSGSEPAALMGSAHVTTQDVSAAITAAIAPWPNGWPSRMPQSPGRLRRSRARPTLSPSSARTGAGSLPSWPRPTSGSPRWQPHSSSWKRPQRRKLWT